MVAEPRYTDFDIEFALKKKTNESFLFRPKSLSRDRDGILYAELDLNMCQLVKEQCGFDQSQRWPEYIDNFRRAAHASYEPQIIRSDGSK